MTVSLSSRRSRRGGFWSDGSGGSGGSFGDRNGRSFGSGSAWRSIGTSGAGGCIGDGGGLGSRWWRRSEGAEGKKAHEELGWDFHDGDDRRVGME